MDDCYLLKLMFLRLNIVQRSEALKMRIKNEIFRRVAGIPMQMVQRNYPLRLLGLFSYQSRELSKHEGRRLRGVADAIVPCEGLYVDLLDSDITKGVAQKPSQSRRIDIIGTFAQPENDSCWQ